MTRPAFALSGIASLIFCLALCLGCGPRANPPSAPPILYVDDLGDGEVGDGTMSNPFRDLQDALDAAPDGATLMLLEGQYDAQPTETVDPTCGNCADDEFRSDIPVTVGFHVHGKAVHLVGADRETTVLNTAAGYGLLFEDARSSSVSSLAITGGVRDADGRATDAGIVVKYTELLVRDVDVRDNNDLYQPGPGEDDPVVGVMGITGREGARLRVVGSRIHNNSWDGISLYRSDPERDDSQASALLIDNSIGCTEGCISPNGRGVGIGITWDASAEVINNRVFGYWKGIGSFGDSDVQIYNNIVEDMHGWGIIAGGTSHMVALNNVVARCGNVGMAAWDASASGRFANNIVVGNGHLDEWVGKKVGVWMNAAGVTLEYNDIWDNEGEDVCQGGMPGSSPCSAVPFDGIDGNVSQDPLFSEEDDYQPADDSPVIDSGDPELLDGDASRSDMGIWGGPQAGRSEP
jgi:hypothetical protein